MRKLEKDFLEYFVSEKSPYVGGFSRFKTIFITGFISGVVFLIISLYFYFVFAMPGQGSTSELKEGNIPESEYLANYQIKVTAYVSEFLGIRRYITENGKEYYVIFGNTPNGYTLVDSNDRILSEMQGMPGDGLFVEIKENGSLHIINVKY